MTLWFIIVSGHIHSYPGIHAACKGLDDPNFAGTAYQHCCQEPVEYIYALPSGLKLGHWTRADQGHRAASQSVLPGVYGLDTCHWRQVPSLFQDCSVVREHDWLFSWGALLRLFEVLLESVSWAAERQVTIGLFGSPKLLLGFGKGKSFHFYTSGAIMVKLVQ